jgi:predicted transcriptional regulator
MKISTNDDLTLLIRAAFPELGNSFLRAFIVSKKSPEGHEKIEAMLFFSEKVRDDVESRVSEFVERIGDYFDSISFSFDKRSSLSRALLLRVIKDLQPIPFDEITSRLLKSNIAYDVKELKNHLDELRKEGFILWSSDHNYRITEKGLGYVPHGNYRASSDITRLLELGKKKW